MVWDISNEDFAHRARRVSLYQSQKMNHEAISQLFEQEQKAEQAQQIQKKEQIQETAFQHSLNTELVEQQRVINQKKLEILERTSTELAKMETHYDNAETLAHYLRKEYFEHIPPNGDNTLLIIATQHGELWAFKVQVMPYPIKPNKIDEIRILMKNED
jgi:hypothetical protein